MTWQDPGGNTPPRGPDDDDATRPDWDLGQLDALVGTGGAGAPEPPVVGPPPSADMPPPTPPTPPTPPGGSPAAPSALPVWAAPPPSPPPSSGYGQAAGYGQGPGYTPGYPPTTAPGMAWAPPPTAGSLPGGLRYAGTLERFVAYLVDGIVMAIIGLAFYVAGAIVGIGPFANLSAGYAGGRYSPVPAMAPGTIALLFVFAFISAAISAAYFVLLWSGSHRATLGMRVLGLQVGNAADGRTITRGQAFRRWIALGGWVGIVGALPAISILVSLGLLVWEVVLLITVVSSPTKQGLHDRFADTAMVQPAGGSGNGLVVGCVLIIGAFLLIFVVAFVALIFLGSQVSNILYDVGTSV